MASDVAAHRPAAVPKRRTTLRYANDLPRLKELLPNIQTPVLILAGGSDPIVPPANGQFLKDSLPRSRFTLLEGGHLVWEDAAAEYADHLASWLGGAYRSL